MNSATLAALLGTMAMMPLHGDDVQRNHHRMRSLSDNILARLNPARLDGDLAAGASPEMSAQHAARARALVTPRARRALADNWEHLLLTSHRPVRGLSGRAPICRERVHRAEPEIQALIAALRATGPLPARGVAIAMTLIADGSGPIYNPNVHDDLEATARLAISHLDPARPLTTSLIESVSG